MKLIKIYSILTSILMTSSFAFEMVEQEQKGYFDRLYAYMGWKQKEQKLPKKELVEKLKELTFNQALTFLDTFIKEEIEHINSKIEPGIKVTSEEFVVVGWLSEQQALSKLGQIIKAINKKSSDATSEELKKALAIIERGIIALNNARESLSYVQSLIAESDAELYPTIDQSFSHLDKFGIDRFKIYTMLGLDSKKRNEYTVNIIINKANELNKKLDPNSELSKQIRQIKFTIGNEIGKKIYDAWLSDKEKNITEHGFLSMLRIDPKDLDLSKVLKLSNRLLMEKVELEQLKKVIEKQLNKN